MVVVGMSVVGGSAVFGWREEGKGQEGRSECQAEMGRKRREREKENDKRSWDRQGARRGVGGLSQSALAEQDGRPQRASKSVKTKHKAVIDASAFYSLRAEQKPAAGGGLHVESQTLVVQDAPSPPQLRCAFCRFKICTLQSQQCTCCAVIGIPLFWAVNKRTR